MNFGGLTGAMGRDINAVGDVHCHDGVCSVVPLPALSPGGIVEVP